MKISPATDANHKINNAVCSVIEHHLPGQTEINCAIVQIKGRYPAVGRAINQACNELAYLQSGNGRVVIEGKEILLNSGDVVLIEKGEKYFWDGDMHLFLSNTPAWYPEQHVYVETAEALPVSSIAF